MPSVMRTVIVPMLASLLFAMPSKAEPLGSMDDVGRALLACWTPPQGAKNSSVTLSFSFKRDGTLIGPPRPTAIQVEGDEKARLAFVDAAVSSVQQCTPLDFSAAVAEGIGGAVFTLPFASPDS